jgi:hypothetical protein
MIGPDLPISKAARGLRYGVVHLEAPSGQAGGPERGTIAGARPVVYSFSGFPGRRGLEQDRGQLVPILASEGIIVAEERKQSQ